MPATAKTSFPTPRSRPTALVADSFNRGNSNFDVRNRFTWNFIYNISQRITAAWSRLTNGWGVNGIVTVQSGQPFQLVLQFEDDYDGSGNSLAEARRGRTNCTTTSDPDNFLDLSFVCGALHSRSLPAFDGYCQLLCSRSPGILATEGRNSLLGPNFRQFDFSIFKNTRHHRAPEDWNCASKPTTCSIIRTLRIRICRPSCRCGSKRI